MLPLLFPQLYFGWWRWNCLGSEQIPGRGNPNRNTVPSPQTGHQSIQIEPQRRRQRAGGYHKQTETWRNRLEDTRTSRQAIQAISHTISHGIYCSLVGSHSTPGLVRTKWFPQTSIELFDPVCENVGGNEAKKFRGPAKWSWGRFVGDCRNFNPGTPYGAKKFGANLSVEGSI